MIAWLTARERWVPAIASLAWWITFYPGLFGEDSLINLTDARSGEISVWFTAWWIYVVEALSLGTTAIPLLTLVGVLALCYSTYFWIATVFPAGRARAITVLVMCATPLVGATGIQVRHDITLACGLLVCAVVLTRTWRDPDRFTPLDYGLLALSMPLVATRHNGMPTVLMTALLVLMAGKRRWRQSLALVAVAVGATLITLAATRASGNSNSVDPIQTVEWLMADISCVLTKNGVAPTENDWVTLGRIAPREAWPQPRACTHMNPILTERIVNTSAIVPNFSALIGVWRSLSMRYPAQMIAAHATRVRLFLPPFMAGVPDMPTFLHSTILPNDFGLTWKFPRLAGTARGAIRGWNALGVILANSAVWVLVLVIAGWRWREWAGALAPSILIALALNLGLLAGAPISEGRYGLVILICGQATAVYLLSAEVTDRRDRRSRI